MLMYDFCNTIENDVKVHVMASVLISDYSVALSDFFSKYRFRQSSYVASLFFRVSKNMVQRVKHMLAIFSTTQDMV